MKAFSVESMLGTPSSWLEASGPESDIILSSRIRLARNLAQYPFVNMSTSDDLAEIVENVLSAAPYCPGLSGSKFADMAEMSELDRKILVERHLISPDFGGGAWPRAALIREDERVSIMVNEEDHLRLQAIASGLDMVSVWQTLDRIDSELSYRLKYAFSEKYGFLTTCPTNVGTGMRVSVLIHLPGLVLTKDIDETLKGVTQIGLSVRGFYGEGTEVLGNLFQISNHITLGKTEEEIIETITQVIRQIIGFERRACDILMKEARTHIEDKIWRAYGILSNSRLLTSKEFMSLSSAVRLGISLGLIPDITMRLLNKLMVSIQPAHLQKERGASMEAGERDFSRASMVRERFNERCPDTIKNKRKRKLKNEKSD